MIRIYLILSRFLGSRDERIGLAPPSAFVNTPSALILGPELEIKHKNGAPHTPL
jgi:hypothetical protein